MGHLGFYRLCAPDHPGRAGNRCNRRSRSHKRRNGNRTLFGNRELDRLVQSLQSTTPVAAVSTTFLNHHFDNHIFYLLSNRSRQR